MNGYVLTLYSPCCRPYTVRWVTGQFEFQAADESEALRLAKVKFAEAIADNDNAILWTAAPRRPIWFKVPWDA